MRKVLADKWIKALRSGKYKQGKNFLRRKVGYWNAEAERMEYRGDVEHCCLGVLYEVANGKVAPTKGFLPWTMEKKLGLSTAAQRELADMNDSGLYSFKSIATWIGKHYKELRTFKGE